MYVNLHEIVGIKICIVGNILFYDVYLHAKVVSLRVSLAIEIYTSWDSANATCNLDNGKCKILFNNGGNYEGVFKKF